MKEDTKYMTVHIRMNDIEKNKIKKRADKVGKPRFVHVRNGIYDLEHQQLLKASPEYAFTSYIGTDYNDDAFIEPSFNGWSLSHFLKEVAKVQQPDGTLKYDPKKSVLSK